MSRSPWSGPQLDLLSSCSVVFVNWLNFEGTTIYIVKLEEKLKREERKQGRSAFLLVCGPGRESLAHQSIMEIVKIQHAPLGGALI